MPRQKGTVQVNQFVGGLNTEASPINFPENSTSDELNIELQVDGTRAQREGFDVELSHSVIDTGVTYDSSVKTATNQFRWKSPGGYEDEEILVVQIANYIGFHKVTENAMSDATLHSESFPTSTYGNVFGFTSIDGALAVVTGEKHIYLFEYDGSVITKVQKDLLIRDFFGVEDQFSGVGDLLDPENLQHRPSSAGQTHIYNLRNQTFALPKTETSGNSIEDPIESFRLTSVNGDRIYPSNADSTVPFMIADPAVGSGSRTVERYQDTDAFNTLPNSTKAPSGYFIINALDRGTSRVEVLDNLYSENPGLTATFPGSLPNDSTPGGPKVVAEFAGRLWYAGFPSSLYQGDNHSPRMSSYILFSQIVSSAFNAGLCYQTADPTSNDPDIVDTDGGYIKIAGVGNVNNIIPLSSSLFIFSDNGVWEISNPDGGYFTASSYSVRKVSNQGCDYGGSVVEYRDTVFYWGSDSIYNLFFDPTSQVWQVQDIAEGTIKTMYESISETKKKNSIGYYDYRTYSIRWLYGDSLSSGEPAKELVLNTKFRAFTSNVFSSDSSVIGPSSVSTGQPIEQLINPLVTVNGVQVTSNSDDVYLRAREIDRYPSQSFYCIIVSKSSTITYTFGGYVDSTHYDWSNIASSAVWPSAYLITGPISAPDNRSRKEVPYLTLFMPYEEDGISCKFSARWGWTISDLSNKWTEEREGYRPTMRGTLSEVVTSRNRIRGNGKSVAFKFESSEGLPIKLLGWSHNLAVEVKE